MTSLKKLAIESIGEYPVTDAAGVPVEEGGQKWSITVHSPGTKVFQKAKFAYDQKRSNSVTALMMGKTDAKRTEEDDARELAEFLAAVTISFNGFDYEGRPGYEGFKAAYMDIEIGHVAEGLNKYLGDRGNFLRKKPSDLSNTSDNMPG